MSDEKTFYDSYSDEDEEFGYVLNQVFVIMPFNSDMDAIYAIIRDECTKLGLIPKRGDEIIGSGIIIYEVTKSIEDAEFIICDLTHERPNVYYELGYAHGVGNKNTDILLIAKGGTNLHFDIAPLRVRYYSDDENLRSILSKNLKGMIAARGK